MHRIDVPTASPLPPTRQLAGTPGYFTSGSFMSGIPATIPGADWFNSVQEELSNAIEGSGQPLDRESDDQLLQAMRTVRRSRHIPGQIIVFAGTSAPEGTLPCDGTAVSRDEYPELFAAIGTLYGEGDGATTFNLPHVDEDTGIIHTGDPGKVGQASAGAVIAHGHNASTQGAGGHGHTVSVGNAGGHAHSASASAVGDHNHGAWTDGQGSHNHGVNDPGHSHTWTGPSNGPNTGGWAAANMALYSPVGTSHNTTGIWLNDGGHHAHNIGMNGAGNHSHSISVAAVGDHSHTASVEAVADHTHAVSVEATGGTRNLAAGIRMLYCIAY